jgi:hypothetical protein
MITNLTTLISMRTWTKRIEGLALITAALLAAGSLSAAEDVLSLAGQWRFQLDRTDAGIQERWCERALTGKVALPGSLPAQGIGDRVTTETKWIGGIVDRSWFTEPAYAKYREPGNIKVPFWLTPEKYYSGAAWYQRDIEVPSSWSGQRVVLSLERPHWETRVWVDNQLIGTNNSLGTPHDYDLGALAAGKHTLTLRVDNRLIVDIGENSHSISDHTQGDWNGIVGRIELRAQPAVWFEDLQVYPNAAAKSVRVKGQLRNANSNARPSELELSVAPVNAGAGKEKAGKATRTQITWDNSAGAFEGEVKLGEDAQLWDEFHPALYELTAALSGAPTSPTIKQVRFGLREIATSGTQFTINGQKTFIRGTLDCCIYPKTGHPPTDVASWKKTINVCKAHGLNLIRFHSWCPPEAAFIAADELGFYFHVEACSWANQSTTLGDGKPVDEWIYAETDRILKYYGNHPSFLLMPYGNEPGGKNADPYLARWVKHYKELDPRRLWTSGAGWPQLPENQFHITPDPRIQAWGAGLKSRINANPPETTTDYRDYIARRDVPVVSHEIGQWCVYPNFDEIPKYTGYLKPRNFEIFRDTLKTHQLGDLAHKFLLASGKLQTLCYKEDIESALRTPGMGGFELLDLHDFPGQGTALVGVLDPFWESKGYVTPEEYSRFCNSTVPLARLSKRVFTTAEKLEAAVETAHFGAAPMQDPQAEWKLVDDKGKTVAGAAFGTKTVPVGNCIPLGTVSLDLKNIPAPARYKLVVGFKGTKFQNDWDIWVYPAQVETKVPAGITCAEELNEATLAVLNKGGKVLLSIPPSRVALDKKFGKIALGFSSIFWNTAWTGRQAPHTLGVLVDPQHPLFAEFPTDFHSNWQWWYLISHAGPMLMDDLPGTLRPTVQVIDDWVTNRRLGLLFEAKVGAGKLVVCSIDLERDLATDPVRRQFRHSLLRYMSGASFAPKNSVTAEQVRALIAPPSRAQKLGLVTIKADSEEAGNEAENVLDGNPGTIWHTAWRSEPTPYPHYLQFESKQAKTVVGFSALPRQDNIRNGWICDYAFYASDDGKNWGQPVKRGTFEATKTLKTVRFEKPVRGCFFKFVAASGFGGQYASLAEFSLLEAGTSGSKPQAKAGSIEQIQLDGRSPGLPFDGVGAVSSGGSTRLLVDYPEPERSRILDYLFKPNYGAALQLLKVEIAADTDATCGAEPSHQRTPDVVQSDLGYEWWLMQEAKARNPNIKLCALAWGAPGWLKGGFWSDDNIAYTLAWLDCAKKKICGLITSGEATSAGITRITT